MLTYLQPALRPSVILVTHGAFQARQPMTLSRTHGGTASAVTAAKTVERPLKDIGLFVIRHSTTPTIPADGSGDAAARVSSLRQGLEGFAFHVEYRVYASGFQPSRNELEGSDDTTPRGRPMGFVVPFLILSVAAWVYSSIHGHGEWIRSVISHIKITHFVYVTIALFLLSVVSTQTVYESVIALPGLGIQLEFQKAHVLPSVLYRLLGRQNGIKLLGLPSKTTTFIPLSSVRPSGGSGADCVFLHEGLQRWSVRFYLGVLYSAGGTKTSRIGEDSQKTMRDTWKVHVLFPNLQPRLPILREVYHGLRETLFDEYDNSPEASPD